MRRAALLLAMLACAAPVRASAVSNPAEAWGAVPTPSPGPTRIIGGPANGCLAGAAMLPPDGVGYEAIRLSRHRNYGHPETIAFVERLGKAAQAAGLPVFYVGDMAQPRGGPMLFGHGSHETGVDVDIWFNLEPKPLLPVSAREEVDLPSMVLPNKMAIDTRRFGERQVQLLRLAASDPRVDRIFVHPAIKRALCDGYGGAAAGGRAWLHKLRPWFGHDEHFHVRLACPADQPECVGQAPVPPGDGCDAVLDSWLKPRPPAPPPLAPAKPRPRPPLPAACRAVLLAK
ncbi:MAG TPA: penicillin-insensitive murein endopeptidase [Stellaceae bacterium]|nr:penicillin-insensitive murein endopeptidase [Stellaceae bacterium]